MPQQLKSIAHRKSDNKDYQVVANDQYMNLLKIKIDGEVSDWIPYSVFSDIKFEIREV